MRVAIFSAKTYDRRFFTAACREHGHEPVFIDARLDPATATLAAGSAAACLFVNDRADALTLAALAAQHVQGLALRSTGFDHVDLVAAKALGLRVARVPAYSPHAVAEHAVGLLLMLNRKLHRAYQRVREGNFALDGLLGSTIAGKTVAIIGTGRIGAVVATIMRGFGCTVLAHDLIRDPHVEELGVRYVTRDEALSLADILSLHVPLNPQTHYLIDRATIARLRPGVLVLNTSRGGLIDTAAAIEGLKSGRIGGLGLDVYEREGDLFFEDRSDTVITDDLFSRLLTFPNVVITGHQAFFTTEALSEIAATTMANLTDFAHGRPCLNELQA